MSENLPSSPSKVFLCHLTWGLKKQKSAPQNVQLVRASLCPRGPPRSRYVIFVIPSVHLDKERWKLQGRDCAAEGEKTAIWKILMATLKPTLGERERERASEREREITRTARSHPPSSFSPSSPSSPFPPIPQPQSRPPPKRAGKKT